MYDYRQINLRELHPDVIYIQNPYDEYHAHVTMAPAYYASRLRELTDKLIYVPYFELKDFPEGKESQEYFCMRHYCTVPGVIYADEIILSSDSMKQRYMEKLDEFSGGRKLPCMNKITVMTHKERRTVASCISKTGDAASDTKKKVVFRNTVSSLYESGEKVLEKIRSVLNTFEEKQDDITFIWSPQKILSDGNVWEDDTLYHQYEDLVEEYKKAGWGEYVVEDEFPKSVDDMAAYYGDPCELALRFVEEKKPVMLMAVL